MLCTACAVLTVLGALYGWGGAHPVIRETAVSWLPDWQRELLGPAARSLTTEYTYLQDDYAGGDRPDLAPYCEVPYPVSLHDIAPIEAGVPGIRWYLERIAQQVADGNLEEAAKFLGVLCHWMEDPSSPSMHCVQGVVSEYGLRELIPPPPDKRGYHYLYGYAGLPGDPKTLDDLPQGEYTPRLLGRSVDEAALHIYQAQRHNAARARPALVPLVTDQMYGDGAKAADIRSGLAFEAAKTSADVIFTALCLATDRCEEASSAHLDAIPLTDLLSEYRGGWAGRPYAWVPFLEEAGFDQQRNVLPLQLAGEEQPLDFERGLGMGAPFALSYTLAPGGVLTSFTSWVGLHPAAGEGGAVRFLVQVNGEVAASVGPLAAGTAGQRIEVQLPATAVVRLTLVTEPAEDSSEYDNLAVWGDPTLHARR